LESFTPFKDYLGKPGCVRPKRLEMQCEKREYDDGKYLKKKKKKKKIFFKIIFF